MTHPVSSKSVVIITTETPAGHANPSKPWPTTVRVSGGMRCASSKGIAKRYPLLTLWLEAASGAL